MQPTKDQVQAPATSPSERKKKLKAGQLAALVVASLGIIAFTAYIVILIYGLMRGT